MRYNVNPRWDYDRDDFCREQDDRFRLAMRAAHAPPPKPAATRLDTPGRRARIKAAKAEKWPEQPTPVFYDEYVPKPARKPGSRRGREIVAELARERQVPLNTLLSQRRLKELVAVRHEAMWRLYEETSLSLPQIGRLMKRDHTTVIHGILKHKERMGLQ